MSKWTSTQKQPPTEVGWYFVCQNKLSNPTVMTLGRFSGHPFWLVPNTSIRYELSHYQYWQPITPPYAVNPEETQPVSTAIDRNKLFEAINQERDRQDRSFRPMPHNMAPTGWLTVLTEEVGEVARAILEGDVAGYEKELIEVAASAIAAIEDLRSGDSSRSLEEITSWKSRLCEWVTKLRKSLTGV